MDGPDANAPYVREAADWWLAQTPASFAEQVRATGRRCEVVAADLSDIDAVAGLAHAAYDAFGRLDTVVNNVGGTFPRAFMDTSPGFLDRAFSFNVTTAHALTRAAVPLMLKNADGRQSVVTISSMMGRTADRGFVAYGTAKGALAHWTRMAAQDLAPLPVGVVQEKFLGRFETLEQEAARAPGTKQRAPAN